MRFLLLSVCVILAAANQFAEDETEILKSTFHQHAIDFMSKFKAFMGSQPSGRPKDVYKTVLTHYKEAMSALGVQRPTGKPYANHKLRSQHNHAVWQLRNNFRKAQSKLRQWSKQQVVNNRAAAVARDGDETEIIYGPFLAHASGFKEQLEAMFANRPTGRPDFAGFMGKVNQKYKEAKAGLKGETKNTHAENHISREYRKAKGKLADHLRDAKTKVKQWQRLVEEQAQKEKEEALKAKVASSPFGAHIATLKKHIDGVLANRLNAKPEFKDLSKSLQQKFDEAKDNMKAARPAKPTKEDKKVYNKATDMLNDHMENAKQQFKTWRDQIAAAEQKKQNELQKQKAKDEDETEIVSFGTHAKNFKDELSTALADPPSNPADLRKWAKNIQQKYEDAKDKLKAAAGKRGKKNKTYKKAQKQLQHHMKDAKDRMNALKVAFSPFGGHISDFKKHVDSAFANQPTGRPNLKQFMDSIRQKYDESRKNLKAAKPTRGSSKNFRNVHKIAENLLKDHLKDAADKVEAWKKKIEDEDETEIISSKSKFHVPVHSFIGQFEDKFSIRPTGRPETKSEVIALAKYFMKFIQKNSAEARVAMNASKSGKKGRKNFSDAFKQLKKETNKAQEKVKAWRQHVLNQLTEYSNLVKQQQKAAASA